MDWFRTPQQRMLTSSAAGWARRWRWRWRWRFVSPWRLGWGHSSWVPESQTSTALWAWGSSTASSRLESGTSNWWGWRWSDRDGRSRWSPAQLRHHAHPRFEWGLRAHSLRVSRSEAVKCSAMRRSVAPPQGPTPRCTPPRNRTRRSEAESPLRVARHRPYRVVPGWLPVGSWLLPATGAAAHVLASAVRRHRARVMVASTLASRYSSRHVLAAPTSQAVGGTGLKPGSVHGGRCGLPWQHE